MADSSRLSTCRARSNVLKPIAVSFDGHVKMRDPARFCSSPAAIHSSQCENFETGIAGRLLPTQRAASHKDSWTKVIAKIQLVHASSQRKASTSNAFSSTFFAAVISAASLRTKPQHFAKVAEAAA